MLELDWRNQKDSGLLLSMPPYMRLGSFSNGERIFICRLSIYQTSPSPMMAAMTTFLPMFPSKSTQTGNWDSVGATDEEKPPL